MKKSTFSSFIENFQFQNLFLELGWNHLRKEPHPVRIGEDLLYIEPINEKEGFHILLCSPNENGTIPEYAVRKKLETKVTRLYREHLIIFTDKNSTEQLWQWMIRKPNQPARISDTRWIKGQSPELIYQKASGLFFSLDEEDEITIVDVRERVAKNFDKNNEKVTKKFYTKFKNQHTRFLKFIEGIEKKSDRDWYTSLMLNRLMFCYFIQKKGFLDGDFNYLHNKLKTCREKKGENKFYNFYQDFLLALFHEGLGAPVKSYSTEIELGTIPYLNGGLFDEHALEKSYDIHIEDEAFKNIFNFFDKWEWHLDTRHGSTGKEINPDVIGYIFEKYINDRADMGAYYTKEDITEYISKNSILPYLFDETERQYKDPFNETGLIWKLLEKSGDTYIYDAVKHGIPRNEQRNKDEVKNWRHTENWWESPVFEDLPEEIKAGLNPNQENLVDIRESWNISAPEEIVLPNEIWREVIERRRRYVEIRQKIDNGEITRINDLITYNLNIRQFVQDVVETIDDPKFILHFYKSIAGDGKNRKPISVLDPTCGSGAFLFAALNILEPLYETCIMRMRTFVEDEDRLNSQNKDTFRHKYKFFRRVLKDIQSDYHPNQEYFVYKSIILRNLYGVDIMREAVEIAKLRLFLKMVATVDVDTSKDNLGLEPLPDIDFNIRAGNTLVGIGNEEEINSLYDGFMDFDNSKGAVEEQCDIVSKAFNHYKQIQLTYGEDFESFKQAKINLSRRLTHLRDKLDIMLKKRHYPDKDLESWKDSHQPFHWYAEFYDIIHDRGGFDVIIGNPPYISMSNIGYLDNSQAFKCSDVYGWVLKRTFALLSEYAKTGFIVMHNLAFSRNFSDLRRLIFNHFNVGWFSSYARIPAGLFSGDVRVRNTILLLEKNNNSNAFYTTRIHRWFAHSRDILFNRIKYVSFRASDEIPMFHNEVLRSYFENNKAKPIDLVRRKKSEFSLHFKQTAYNWIAVSKDEPPCYDDQLNLISQSQVKELYFDPKFKNILLPILNGQLMFSRWLTYGDEFHVTITDISNFRVPFDKFESDDFSEVSRISKYMEDNMDQALQFKMNAGKKVGTYKTSIFWPKTNVSDLIILKQSSDNPYEILDAVHSHVTHTVVTDKDEEEHIND